MVRYLVQDIETLAASEIVDMWDPEREGHNERYPGDKPFPPIWCWKVLCIGMLALDAQLRPVKGGCAAGGLQGGKSEKEMIKRWSYAVSGRLFDQKQALKMVDYNGTGFDVPVLQTRAFRYGVQLPWYFGLLPDNKGGISSWSKEYRDKWNGHHYDIQNMWTNHRAFRYPHLENLARLMGLPGKTGIDGSMVEAAYKEGRYAEIDTYCMQDVFQTAFIFIRFYYLKGRLDIDQYRDSCQSMLDFIEQTPEQKEFLEKIDRGALLLE